LLELLSGAACAQLSLVGPIKPRPVNLGHAAARQLPLVALLINIGLIALAAWIVQGPFVALLAIVGFVAVILSALRVRRIAANFAKLPELLWEP
jgi:hypothetical protein